MATPGLTGIDVHWEGEQGDPVLFVAGPPTSGVLFREVQARLRPLRTGALDLVSGPRVVDVEALTDRLAAACVELGARVLVAHGLAVPLAWRVPVPAAPHLVLSNGPVQGLHTLAGGLASLPVSLWERVLLRPGLAGRWLSSSAALRRAVVNPYVMGRETVERLLTELIADPDARANTATWVTGLPRLLPLAPGRGGRVDGIWGEADTLHPISRAEGLFQSRPDSQLLRIPGGQWLHPEERPWALADALAELLAPQTTT